ncbi:3-keto-5-aminohexanoate cleavage protein [Streptomyces sp. enrichment culture]|uniref:3-keto-5-aminohexanoate cleavage protein n=1 Tax=Streptomyces sp. enrichment culture TaxID=1795815 RepID=UPI003F5635BC
MIQACLNGGRTVDEHPEVPVTPGRLADEARAARAAGARSVHLHPRDAAGRESLDGAVVEEAVRAVRQACPGLPVGVSTGLWMCDGDAGARQAAVEAWGALTVRPDFASVNVGEPGFEELAEVLTECGVGVEAGVWSEEDAARLLAGPHAASCLRVLVEMIGLPPAEALSTADRVLGLLARARVPVPLLLHGEDESTWPVLDRALALGLETRIGLEDTLTDPRGRRVDGNAALVRIAFSRASALGRA